MIKEIAAGLVLVTGLAVTPLVLGGDEELCLECHEPGEDWQGLTPKEIITKAQDPDNDMHEDNMGLTEEQLKDIIATLLGK